METLSAKTKEILSKQPQSIIEDGFFNAMYLPEIKTILCETKAEYIPSVEFKMAFYSLGDFIKNQKTEKLIFDKRNMRQLDKASMNWYHIYWKDDMKMLGLKCYRKILPEDKEFRGCVEKCRAQMVIDYPAFKFENYDILYCESLQEALDR